MSAYQFAQPDFGKQIDEILVETQLDPQCLKLEITETVIIQNFTSAADAICSLHERSIQFSIDDFGTGYSSLRRLTDFPIDILKIDRSFINNEEWIIVKAIGTLAFTLGKKIVVEGIETTRQLATLKTLFSSSLDGCYGQGYLFAKPLDAESAAEFLTNVRIHIPLVVG